MPRCRTAFFCGCFGGSHSEFQELKEKLKAVEVDTKAKLCGCGCGRCGWLLWLLLFIRGCNKQSVSLSFHLL